MRFIKRQLHLVIAVYRNFFENDKRRKSIFQIFSFYWIMKRNKTKNLFPSDLGQIIRPSVKK